MAKIQKICSIEPTLGFTKFDIASFYCKSFQQIELDQLHRIFAFESFCKSIGLRDNNKGRKNFFSSQGKIALMILKSYTVFSDQDLFSHLNSNLHYQFFCDIFIDPPAPLTNYKLISSIRGEIGSLLDISSGQQVLADHWKPYLENLHVCMTDTTCNESAIRSPPPLR